MKTDADRRIAKVLRRHWRNYRRLLQDCRRQAGEKQVHDFRVASRRLLAAVTLCQLLKPDVRARRLQSAIKQALRGLNRLRDAQVMLREIQARLDDMPELEDFLGHLRRRESELLKQAGKQFKSINSGKLKRQLAKIRRCCAKKPLPEPALALSGAIGHVYAEVMARYLDADSAQWDSLHKLRISLKQLRYIALAAADIKEFAPPTPAASLEELTTLLGDLQNAHVLQQELQEFYPGGAPPEVESYFARQRRELIAQFEQRKAEIPALWRPDSSMR